jgi:hypothetical protein
MHYFLLHLLQSLLYAAECTLITILRIFVSSPHLAGCPGGGERVQVQGDPPPHRLLGAGGGECCSSETGLPVSLCHEIDFKKFDENRQIQA